jgi:putative tricarboxylic transport membrane protein
VSLRALPPLVLFGWALFMVWSAQDLRTGTPGHPGPGFFPFWIALALALVSLTVLVRELSDRAAPALSWHWGHVAAATLALLVFAPAMGLLGFVPAATLFLVALLRVMGTRWIASVLIAAGIAVATHAVFALWLRIQFPRGPLGF